MNHGDTTQGRTLRHDLMRFMACLCFVLPMLAHAQITLRVGIYENPPKIFHDESGKPAGIFVDLLTPIAQTEQWQVQYIPCEWQECLTLLQAGQLDLMPDVAQTPEREALFAFHRTPALASWSQLYAHPGVAVQSLLDLNGHRIAVLNNSVQQQFIENTLKGFGLHATVVPTRTLAEAFELARSHQVDIVVANNRVGDWLAPRSSLVETQVLFQPSQLFFAAPLNGDATILQAIDQHLQQWRDSNDPQYQAILERWAVPTTAAVLPALVWKGFLGLSLIGLLLMVTVLITRRQLRHQVMASRSQQAKLQAIIDAVPDLLFELGEDGTYHDFHSPRTELLAAPPESLIGKTVQEILPDAAAKTVMVAIQIAAKQGFSVGQQLELTLPVGVRCFELSVARKRGHDTPAHYIVLSRDITERKQAEAEQKIAAVAFETHEAMLIADANWSTLQVNEAYCQLTGYDRQELLGVPARQIALPENNGAILDSLRETLKVEDTWRGELLARHRDGRLFPAAVLVSTVRGAQREVTHYIVNLTDITLHKAAEEQIRSLAFFDPLTKLPNRRLLYERLEKALLSARRHQQHGALLFLDLDNFKTLNDTLGHAKGDQLLQQVALRLQSNLRDNDTVARVGGDEFVILLDDLGASRIEAGNTIEAIASKLQEAIRLPFELSGKIYQTTCSIGISLFDGIHADEEELLKQADLAMYRVKTSGRDGILFFDPEMQASVLARTQLEDRLKNALRENQFELYYQPQYSQDTLLGAEALIRWNDPQRGVVSPGGFIPLAEETGLILELGAWVLETACRQLQRWASQSAFSQLSLSVNVSAKQFMQPAFVELVQLVLRRTGANPRRLKLELTESMLAENVTEITQKMMALKAMGIGFSLDDFGTGYSSLTYLKRLPLDQLKIDQSFVRDIMDDPNDAAIAQTIVALANNLGLSVIAEGVETPAQRERLAELGCLAYQGYLFGRPENSQAFEQRVVRVMGTPG